MYFIEYHEIKHKAQRQRCIDTEAEGLRSTKPQRHAEADAQRQRQRGTDAQAHVIFLLY